MVCHGHGTLGTSKQSHNVLWKLWDWKEENGSAYAAISPDYIIGSVHFVVAPDGARVCVDESPESLDDAYPSAAFRDAAAHAFVRKKVGKECGDIAFVERFCAKWQCAGERDGGVGGEIVREVAERQHPAVVTQKGPG